MSDPVLSIVVPSYNGRHLLETCLASVETHRPADVAIEVIVSDDGSTDGTPAWLAVAHPGVRLVRREQNGGFVAAANAGIEAARGAFIQLLNNDTEVTAGWVEAGLKPFEDPTVGSVAPLVLVRSDPARVDSAGDQYAVFGWPSKRGHGEPERIWSSHPADRVFGASGSSAFYRVEALRHVGAYDPLFGSYYEDVDLAFRLRWAGYGCAYAPGCRILHAISMSYDHGRPELQRRMARNAELLFWGDLPLGWILVALGPHLAFTAAQGLIRAIQGRFWPFLLGKLDAVRLVAVFRRHRQARTRLARAAIARPHFPFRLAPVSDLRNHLRRPRGVR
jgi:GT2 family glycosyltransferase